MTVLSTSVEELPLTFTLACVAGQAEHDTAQAKGWIEGATGL